MSTVDPEVAANSQSLVALMSSVLESVRAAFATAGVTLPSRQYYTLGTPVADDEQLVVSFNQAYIGPPGDQATQPQRCNSPRSAALQVGIYRCAPVMSNDGVPPTPLQIVTATNQILVDSYILLDAACQFDAWDPTGLGPGLGVIATVDAIPQEGNMHGSVLNLTLAVP